MFRAGLRFLILLPILFLFLGCDKEKSNEAGYNSHSYGSLKRSLGDFYFVGMADGNPGIYKFNSNDKSTSCFWSKKNEKVIELSYSPDRKHIFFLTASAYGKQGVLPFVKNVNLYLIKIDSSRAELVQKVGSGIQIFTAWESNNSFKIILNSFDKTVANFINQETLIFSEFGRKLLDNSKTFDITKEGYPKPPENKNNFISPDGERLSEKSDSSEVYIYLSSKTRRTVKLITKTNQDLNDAEWSASGKFLVFSTLNISSKNSTLDSGKVNTSKLYVYSMSRRRITKAWEGSGLKNFFIKGSFLIFDDGFGGSSSIHVFNYINGEMVYTIRIKGGCGLRNIPLTPNYGT